MQVKDGVIEIRWGEMINIIIMIKGENPIL